MALCDFFKRFAARAPASSLAQRNTQRTNAAVQITGQLGKTIADNTNPLTLIPITFSQTLISLHAIFRSDTYPSEKLMQLLQAFLAGLETGIAIYLQFEGINCSTQNTGTPCNLLKIVELLYAGTLLVTWVPSEISKDSALASVNIPNARIAIANLAEENIAPINGMGN